jgi:hypothetical protein
VEACNLIHCLLPFGRSNFRVTRDQPQPGSYLNKREEPGNEVDEGSGIIRFREDSDWPLKWMRSSILATIPGFRQRIIPEPSFPSQGSQARGTRLNIGLTCDQALFYRPDRRLI